MKKTAVYQTIQETCETTGLSQYYLRSGCKEGKIPYIQSGSKYLINVPLLLEKLEREALDNVDESK